MLTARRLGSLETRIGSLATGRTAWAVLGVEFVGAALWVLHEGRGLTFFQDEWDFVIERQDNGVGPLLNPHYGHLVVVAVVLYKVMLAIFGMNYAAFRVLGTAFLLTCALLTYVLARRRIGPALALIPPALLLFLGPAWVDLLLPFQIGFTGALACGLGALLALERRDVTGDVLACGLLMTSIGFSEIGLAFLVGIAIDVAVRSDRPRRALIVVVPFVLYVLWWSHWGRQGLYVSNVYETLPYVASAIAYAIGSLTGLGVDWGRPLALVFVFLIGRRLVTRRASVQLWVGTAAALTFWLLLSVARASQVSAGASRYIYPGALFVLLISLEALHGFRIESRPMLLALAVGTIAVVVTNVGTLGSGRDAFRTASDYIRAELGAVELARQVVSPDFAPDPDRQALEIGRYLGPDVLAGDYLRAVESWGSPAYRPSEIVRLAEPVREAADGVLMGALDVRLAASRFAARAAAPPQVVGQAAVRISRHRSCLLVAPANAKAYLDVRVPRAGIGIRDTTGAKTAVAVRQLAGRFATRLANVAASSAVLKITGETPTLPTYARLRPTGETTVCALAQRG